MKFRVKTQRDFDKVRALALLSEVLSKDEMKEFFEDVFDDYYPVNPVLAPFEDGVWDVLGHQMNGYFSFYEQEMWDLYYMYVYNYVMNYTYNVDNEDYGTTFENTTSKALKRLGMATMNKATSMVRGMSIELEKEVKKNPPQVTRDGVKLTLHILFVWKTREDKKVCPTCASLDGQEMIYIPTVLPHPNCRCDFVVYEWWTDPDGNIKADRSYEIEQNDKAKGKGYSIRQAKVTSKLVDGEQITLFEVEDDGKISKKTFKKEDK